MGEEQHAEHVHDIHEDSTEAIDGEPGEVFYAFGKRYRKREDGKVEFIGYQDVPEVADDTEHA